MPIVVAAVGCYCYAIAVVVVVAVVVIVVIVVAVHALCDIPPSSCVIKSCYCCCRRCC